MKKTLAYISIGLFIFYVGAEVGYKLAYDSVKCIRPPVSPNKTVII